VPAPTRCRQRPSETLADRIESPLARIRSGCAYPLNTYPPLRGRDEESPRAATSDGDFPGIGLRDAAVENYAMLGKKRVGSHVNSFMACSALTRDTACRRAAPPSGTLVTKAPTASLYGVQVFRALRRPDSLVIRPVPREASARFNWTPYYLYRRSDRFRLERPSWQDGTRTHWQDPALSHRTRSFLTLALSACA
jgi:hypothetical protein